jgi:hypothetical protein
MGTRGPLPKRDAEVAGHKAKKDKATAVESFSTVPVPEADPYWCSEAKEWYASLDMSGQSRFFEPSDWQQALIVGALITQLMAKPSAPLAKVVLAAMSELGSTEAARRRMRIEVERPEGDAPRKPGATDDAVAGIMDRYAALAGAQ